MRRDKPILFSGSMVRAILREIEKPGSGKTQTRRIVPERLFTAPWRSPEKNPFCDHIWPGKRIDDLCPDCYQVLLGKLRFAIGDVLWVRETWCKGPIGRDGVVEDWSDFIYRATSPEVEGIDDGDGYAELNADGSIKSCWKASIHMPRIASRLTLEVTNVRVERLQDISKNDVIAEGITEREGAPIGDVVCGWHEPYAQLWNAINGPGEWEKNPFVVAVTFRPHLMNIDAFLKQREAA